VTNIFAFEETGRENRERWQCGVEFLGSAGLTSDVEIISMVKEVVRNLGLKNIRLQLSHAGLTKALIRELGLTAVEEAKVTDRILDGDWQALLEAKMTKPELNRFLSPLLNLKGKSSSFLQNIKALCPHASSDLKASMEDFINITTLLDSLSCDYEIDITAIRGFEYYTGVCFQLLVDGEKIGGGGRYDNLIPLMGGNATACGFALYVDPVMELLPLESKKSDESKILIKGKEATPEITKACFKLAQTLRERKYIVEINFSEQTPDDEHWIISIPGGEPGQFEVTDCKRQQHWNVTSTTEVFNILAE